MAKAAKNEALTSEERLEQALVPEDEQPYGVPANWVWTRLEYISSVISKGTTPKTGKDAYLLSGIGFLRVENLNDDGTINHENIKYISKDEHQYPLKRSILKEGDVLISIAGTLGKTAIIKNDDLPLNTNQAISFIRLTDKISNKFIEKAISCPTIKERLLSQTKVTSIPNLTLEIISRCPVPLPPLAEQQRIVDRIESIFAKLDAAKELAQSALDSFETRKAAILHKAFTGELTAHWRKEHGVGIGSWEDLTLNDIAEYKKGPFGSSITKAMFVQKGDNTYKVYEQGNAIRKSVEYGHYYISEKKYEELKGFTVYPGDIIISCAGTIGEVYKLPQSCENGIINQALMRVRVKQNTDDRYFYYYFGEILKSDINDKANGTAIKNIPPFSVLKNILINLPPLPEQQEIVRILDSLFTKEQKAKELYNLIDKIDLIKKAILARAFRGQLGTNDPAEESALELLKQVLSEN